MQKILDMQPDSEERIADRVRSRVLAQMSEDFSQPQGFEAPKSVFDVEESTVITQADPIPSARKDTFADQPTLKTSPEEKLSNSFSQQKSTPIYSKKLQTFLVVMVVLFCFLGLLSLLFLRR